MVTRGFAVTCPDINIVEQPARMPLAPTAQIAQRRVNYHRGITMQLSLAIEAVIASGSQAVPAWLIDKRGSGTPRRTAWGHQTGSGR